MSSTRQPPCTQKVERGLQALSEAAGAIPDPDGSVASARRWLAARLSRRGEEAREALEPADAAHGEVVKALVLAWEAEHGTSYPFAPRDAQAVRTLRQMPDWDLGRGLQRWNTLLSDPWWRRRGVSIPDLVSQWARLASAVCKGPASKATSAAETLARMLEGRG